MKAFFKAEKTLFLKICLFVAATIAMYEYLWASGQAGKLMFVLYIFVAALVLFYGMIVGLSASLLLIFIMGSIILYFSIQNIGYEGLFNQPLSIEAFFVYGFGLLITVLFGGFINEQLFQIVGERNRLRRQVSQFVAIDPYTLFDNTHRMELEIEGEMNRVNRYGGKFTLLFLELDYYYEFTKIYGHKEEEHLLHTIGMKVNESLRSSDRKFRYSENKFAFLLPETSKDYAEIVVEKLQQRLCSHKLLNGKNVTLSFHISFEEYNDYTQDTSPLEFINMVEQETIFYAM